MNSVAVIIPAAGSGKRLGTNIPKAFFLLDGEPMLSHTVRRFLNLPEVHQILIPLPAEFSGMPPEELLLPADNRILYLTGGKERIDSIQKALQFVDSADFVAVHDAARPFASEEDIRAVFDKAFETDAAILAVPASDTLKVVNEKFLISHTADRTKIWQALTPQVFRTTLLARAYKKASDDNYVGTDDASLVERIGHTVSVVVGKRTNIKITYPADLQMAEYLLQKPKKKNQMHMRTGIGYDVHRLKEGRKLILGGVEIPFEKGLDGHSDADVLIHAIIDAITGALALGDIGSHFPDDDQAYKNADSRMLLRKIYTLISGKGYAVINADATIVAERPKLSNYIPKMRDNLANDLNVDVGVISVKATTSEKIGCIGREEGMSAMATVLLEKII